VKREPIYLGDLRYTDSKGRDCERIAPRIKYHNRPTRGWNWFAPYDKQKKCFLTSPAIFMNPRSPLRLLNNRLPELGSYIAGEVWFWIECRSIKEYEKSISPKEFARIQRVLERYKVKQVEQRLDGAA
jgi:hypothetical protein